MIQQFILVQLRNQPLALILLILHLKVQDVLWAIHLRLNLLLNLLKVYIVPIQLIITLELQILLLMITRWLINQIPIVEFIIQVIQQPSPPTITPRLLNQESKVKVSMII